jgi:hypothetical protein
MLSRAASRVSGALGLTVALAIPAVALAASWTALTQPIAHPAPTTASSPA